MTEVASRPAQAPSINNLISRSGPSKTSGPRPGENAREAYRANDQVRDRVPDRSDLRDRRAEAKSVDSAPKVSEKPHHENDRDDDSEASFEATIDTIGSQTTGGPAQDTAPAHPAPWTTIRASGTAQVPASADNSASAGAIPGHILKQASVVALLDARQRLMAAQDMPATDAPLEETVTTPVEINSRATHWLFEDGKTGASPRVSDALAKPGTGENALAALNAATTGQIEDGPAKVTTDVSSASPAAEPKAADGAAPQQNFTGAQDGKSGSREQSRTADADPRRILDASAPASSKQVSEDKSETPYTMSTATHQVRSGVLNALAGEGSNTDVFIPRQAPDRPAVAGQVLRAIDLTLSPPDLGTVRLKLSLKASALDIDAEASKTATAKLLDDDRKGLEQSLRDAGYDVKSLKISEVSSSSSSSLNSSLNNGASSFQDGSQARGNLAGRQDDGMSRREGGTPNQSQQRQRDDNPNASRADSTSGQQANAIYI